MHQSLSFGPEIEGEFDVACAKGGLEEATKNLRVMSCHGHTRRMTHLLHDAHLHAARRCSIVMTTRPP